MVLDFSLSNAKLPVTLNIWQKFRPGANPHSKACTTTWLAIENGFGIRRYASERHVYIVQTRMSGRMRTITIGPATVITRHRANMVVRRVIALCPSWA